MKTLVVAMLAACVVSCGIAQPFESDPARPRSETYALEGLGGVVGLGVGAACGVGVSLGVGYVAVELGRPSGWFGPEEMWYTAFAFTLTMPAWAGLGVSAVGAAMGTDGSRDGAMAGAYIGALAGVGVALLGHYASGGNDAATTAGISVGALLIPAGAVIGYHRDATYDVGVVRPGGRAGLPAVALGRCLREDRTSELGVKVQMASLRF